jgi:hypothetical protein
VNPGCALCAILRKKKPGEIQIAVSQRDRRLKFLELGRRQSYMVQSLQIYSRLLDKVFIECVTVYASPNTLYNNTEPGIGYKELQNYKKYANYHDKFFILLSYSFSSQDQKLDSYFALSKTTSSSTTFTPSKGFRSPLNPFRAILQYPELTAGYEILLPCSSHTTSSCFESSIIGAFIANFDTEYSTDTVGS